MTTDPVQVLDSRNDSFSSPHPESRLLAFASFLAPQLEPLYDFVVRTVGARLGIPTKLYPGTTFSQFATGGADVGFLCGLPYVLLTRRPNPPVEAIAAPVLQGERYGGRPIYFSDVIVRRESPYRSFADLRGCRWSYNDDRSHSGYNITRYTLVQLEEVNGFFGSVIEAGSHQQSLRLLLAGKIDATAIDSHLTDLTLRDDPTLRSAIRCIGSLGPATIQPIVAATVLAPGLREQLRKTISTLHQDATVRAALGEWLVERFVPVDDADYNDIRAMVTAAERIGYYRIQ